MPKEYSKEQLWKLYEKIPQELKEAIFSEDTAESIWEICSRNGIEDERISEIARYTGRVLLGILPPADFQETLEKELKLGKEVAKKVSQEINRFIFYPVKPALEQLYQIGIAPSEEIEEAPSRVSAKEEKTEISEKKEEKPETPPRKDTYREPVE